MTDDTMSGKPGAARHALRRLRAARRKRSVLRLLPHYFDPQRPPSPARIGLYARTPRPCSCALCGNPRRWLGEPTVQERRAAERMRDGLCAD